jgi:SAM-dependent methyltransferase
MAAKMGAQEKEARAFERKFLSKRRKLNTDWGWAFGWIEPEVFEAAAVIRPQGFKRALDIGAGFGRHSFNILRKRANEVHATDISPYWVKRLHNRAKREHVENVEVLRHPMDSIPFKDGSYDLIVHWDVLAHGNKEERERAMHEAHRLLEKGGLLVLSTLSEKHANYGKGKEVEPNTFVGGLEGEWGEPHHYFSREELEKLLKGFEIIKMDEKKRIFGYNKGGIHWNVIARKK